MRALLIALLAFLICTTCGAQVFPVETIFENGSKEFRINLVFLPDGYQQHEMNQFRADVNTMLVSLFAQPPFGPYKPYFNAYLVEVPSEESGATHPQTSSDNECSSVPVKTVNNYFGSAFDSFGVHRLLVPTQWAKLANVLASNLPQYDQAFIVVNSLEYGGSGGEYATFSTNTVANEVAIHEMGHSFAGLADEYWAGPAYAFERPNLTQQGNPATVKWSPWVATDNVGVYPHTEAPSWFRPHQNCKMRYLNMPLCAVCRETMVERIHSLVQPIQSFSPATTTLSATDEPLSFSLSLISPQPNSLSVTWKRNNVVFATNQTTVSVNPASFSSHSNTITATVTDATDFVRTSSHSTSHTYVIEWTVNASVVTGLEIDPTITHYAASVYPNPVEEKINLSYSLQKSARVRIGVTDLTGRSRVIVPAREQPAGDHSYEFESEALFARPGEYIITFWFDDTPVSRKVIKD